MEASAAGPVQPTSGAGTGAHPATRVHLALIVLMLISLFVQVYLAGRGAFGAGTYEAHESFGGIVHTIPLLLIISAAVGPQTRNRQDIGMAVILFVLVTIQVFIGDREHPGVAAFHPVNALLLVGLSFGILARTREHLGGR